MTYSLDDIQSQIISFVDSQMQEPLYEEGIPDATTVKRTPAGKVAFYIVYQFADSPAISTRSMAGPRGDDYSLVLRFQVVGPDAKTVRRINNKLNNVLVGKSFPWAGGLEKRYGGPAWPITASNAATEAYVQPSYYRLAYQMANY